MNCEFCGHTAPCKYVPGCPGNPATKSNENPHALKAMRDAVIAKACARRGLSAPRFYGERVSIDDIYDYIEAAMLALRKFEPSAFTPAKPSDQ